MKHFFLSSLILLICLPAFGEPVAPDSTLLPKKRTDIATVLPNPFSIPEKAVVLSGDSTRASKEVVAVIYNVDNLSFNDPSVPRFQFFDRQGNTILGIGGQAEVFGYADFEGIVDGYEFDVWNISRPNQRDQKSQIGATPSQTSIFLKLAHSTKIGVFSMYVNANFAQGDNKRSFGLRQAYVSFAGITAGYARSTFSDPSATVPSIDPFGPIGTISRRNILLAYRRNFKKHIYATLSVEMPSATYTTDEYTRKLNQRFPDIPVNVQYTWYNGSHIRFAAILRNLNYRNLLTNSNHIVTGYGFQLSGLAAMTHFLDLRYQIAYGKGIGYYIKGTARHGVDLIPSLTPGKMLAPATFSLVAGLQFNISKRVYISTSYSMARLYDQQALGPDMFRRGEYIDANAFWSPLSGLQLGLGYIHGKRVNSNRLSGDANRALLMVKYSF